jgi:hypothetical protein
MVKYDRFINFCSTHIVAISENVKNVLIKQEGVSESKIHLIHHGFDQTLFDFNNELLKSTLKTKYKLTSNDPIIGVVSRYTKWKGIQFIIPAFKALLLEFPNAKLVLANASGDYKQHIQLMLSELPSNSYCEIEFEKDIFALYSTFFKTLIMWRNFSDVIDLSFFDTIYNFLAQFGYVVGIIYYPFLYVANLLANININLKAVNVTCSGAQAPIRLLINCFIASFILVIIEYTD